MRRLLRRLLLLPIEALVAAHMSGEGGFPSQEEIDALIAETAALIDPRR